VKAHSGLLTVASSVGDFVDESGVASVMDAASSTAAVRAHLTVLRAFCTPPDTRTTAHRLTHIVYITHTHTYLFYFYPRDALHNAVFAVVRCPSVCQSICHTPILCLNG